MAQTSTTSDNATQQVQGLPAGAIVRPIRKPVIQGLPAGAIVKPLNREHALDEATEETSTGIRVPKGMIDTGPDVIKSIFHRGKETLGGMYHTIADPPTTEELKEVSKESSIQGIPENIDPGKRAAVVSERIRKGFVGTEKEAMQQAVEQYRQAKSLSLRNAPIEKGLKYAQAGVTAASAADPFATGSVTNINKLTDDNHYKQALGSAIFDAVSLIAGARIGEEPTPETALNKLAYATGAKQLGTVKPLETILPDLEKTVRVMGKPTTLVGLQDIIKKMMTVYEHRFNGALAGIANSKTIPSDIADALEVRARLQPPSTEGQEIAQELNAKATEYRRPWTYGELNRERMMRNSFLNQFYGKGDVKQMAALRSGADQIADKIIGDGSRDILYDEMERRNPGGGFRDLKSKESAVFKMMDNFNERIEALQAQEAYSKGAPALDKYRVSMIATPSRGVHPFIHRLASEGETLSKADKAVLKAFQASPRAKAARIAVLAMPIEQLTKGEQREVNYKVQGGVR